MKPNIFIQQTHFIGVLLPEDLTLTLEDCRRYMNEAYGCKSGHGTPIHVTLVPPFRLQEEYSTEDLARAIEKEVLPKLYEDELTVKLYTATEQSEKVFHEIGDWTT